MGGTMRLGADPVKLHAGTKAREIYGEAVIYERHRHRYEVNNFLRRRLEAAGLVVSGTTPDERLVEMIELADHPFFVASQYHPEFKSRPERPAPLFREFVGAAQRYAQRAPPARAARDRRADPRRPARGRRGAAARAHGPLPAALTCGRPARPRRRGSTRRSPRSAGSRARSGARPRSPRTSRASSRAWASASRPTRAATCSTAIRGRSDRTVLLCAHLDTVEVHGEIEPVVVDGGWENAHDTILGADNKAAVAVFLEVARRASVEGSPVGIELLLTRRGGGRRCAGAKAFDAVGAAAPTSATCSTTRRRSARSSSRRRPTTASAPSSTAAPRTPASARRPAAARSSPPRTRSRRCRTAGSTSRRPRTSARSRAAAATTNVVPERCRVHGRGALARRRPRRGRGRAR